MTSEERRREHSLLEQERKRVPELFNTEPLLDSPEILRWIGIEDVFGEYPLGHIKYMPEDFIVEEISLDKSIVTVDVGPAIKNLGVAGGTLFGELVKVDMTTFEAKETLAKLLCIDVGNIGTAGLKDEVAITAQKISLRNVKNAAVLANLHEEAFFIKNVVPGKGILRRGNLLGNRFIITVRTQDILRNEEKERIQKAIHDLSENGFWNFFYSQRFAAPRLNGHLLGRHILRGEYEDALKNLLCYRGLREEPYFQRIREESERQWRNWRVIQEKMKSFPLRFSTELPVLEHLNTHPGDFVGAIRKIPEQVRLWIYGYSSFLFNRKLSQYIKEGEVPLHLPFITSRNRKDQELYEEFLTEDGIRLDGRIYYDFPFLRFSASAIPSLVPTLQKVEVSHIHFGEKMVVIAFSLPKGTYATTFLAHLFQLSSEAPLPQGVDTTLIDAKEILGIGSLKKALERFSVVLARLKEERKDTV